MDHHSNRPLGGIICSTPASILAAIMLMRICYRGQACSGHGAFLSDGTGTHGTEQRFTNIGQKWIKLMKNNQFYTLIMKVGDKCNAERATCTELVSLNSPCFNVYRVPREQLDQAMAAANQVLETITVISVISPITGAILITDLTTPTRCSFLY